MENRTPIPPSSARRSNRRGATRQVAPGVILLTALYGFFPPAVLAKPIEVPSGALYIVDPDSTEVLWKNYEFHSPMEVRRLSDDRFLVCDFGSARVAEIDRLGKILWETPANNPDNARRLSNGGTLIVNNGNSEIHLLDASGRTYRIYREGLDHPASAIATASDTLIVADTFHQRIVELDPKGGVIRENREVSNPLSLEPDGDGSFLIADANLHQILRLDKDWKLERVAAGFHHPSDAKRLPNGSILVADTNNGRVVEVNELGNVTKAVQFDQKPRSVDVLSDGTWLVAITFEEKRIEEDRRSIEERIASGEAGNLSNVGPANSFRERRRYAFALALLFGAVAVWLVFQLRRRPIETAVGADNGGTLAPKFAPPEIFETPKPRLTLSKRKRILIGTLCYLIVNGVLLAVYLDRSQTDSIRVDCRGSRISVFFGDQEIGSVQNAKVLGQGHIALSFWRESANDQACERVVVRKLDSGEILYEADFRRAETLSEWVIESGDWRVTPGVGVVNDSNRAGTLRYERETFGDASVEFRLRDAAEVSVSVRAQGQTDYTKFTLRPERHMDAWVELNREGQRIQNPSPPFAKITPPFKGQVLRIVRQLLGSYFFAAVLAMVGALGFLLLYPIVAGMKGVFRSLPFLRDISQRIPTRVWRLGGEGLAFTIAAGLSVWMFYESKWVAEEILDKMPHLQDSVAYLFQAKIFAGGDLWVPSQEVPYRRFFDHEFIVNNGKWFGLYTPGTPLLLAIGVLWGKVWLVNPTLAGLSVFVLFLCGRSGYGTWVGLLASFFLCLSPWVPLMSGTLLSHPGSLLFTLLLIWGLASGSSGKKWFSFFLAGFGLSGLLLIRPGSGVAIGISAVAWALVHLGMNLLRDYRLGSSIEETDCDVNVGRTNKNWTTAVFKSRSFPLFLRYCALGSLCLGAIAFLFFYNWRLSGDPLTNTYQAYSPHLRLGFSPEVGIEWGVGHDRDKAITNLSANLKEMYRYILSPPNAGASKFEELIRDYFQIWLFAPLFGVFLLLDRKPTSYLLLAIVIGEFAFYYCWFHSGISYGPRFYYSLMGPIALLSARGAWLCSGVVLKLPGLRIFRNKDVAAIVAAILSSILLLAPALTPSGLQARKALIRSFKGYNGMNRRMLEGVEQAQLENAVVFVDSEQSWIPYGNLFWSMSPHLDDPVLFARDRGLHNVPKPGNTPLDNKLLREVFPDRKFYKLAGNRPIPIE